MAKVLPAFSRSGLRAVPYYAGPSLRAWRIDVRGQRGVDLSDEMFAELGKLSHDAR